MIERALFQGKRRAEIGLKGRESGRRGEFKKG
jgi:hypothetical protein